MWIIRFEHERKSFQRCQSLLYDSNLRSLLLDQSQDVIKVEISLYKEI